MGNKKAVVKEKITKKSKTKKDNKTEGKSYFEKELAKLPTEFQEKLKKYKKDFEETAKIINKKIRNYSIGFYITPKIEMVKNVPTPNFDDLVFNFLFDDYEKPLFSEFDPRIALEKEFDKILVEEKKKNEKGEEFVQFVLKTNKNIKFVGTTISRLRENCFDAIYDDLKTLSSSIIFEDTRGFISALKSIDIHRNMLLQKFEKYIVAYVGAGSWLRGEKSNDFDVFIVVDDTDVKRMPRMQVKDQLTRIIWQMAGEVARVTDVQLHCQVYLLTDFWDSLKDAHPVMFTFLRDGVPFYDRGIYSAWKELLKLGKIRPSAEAIDMHMNVGTQLIDRAKKTFADILMNDIYYSVLNPSQAILMLKGFNPTTPKETIKMFKDVLLAKEKCITKEDVSTLKEIVTLFKKIEHNRDFKITGTDIDRLIKNSELFLKNIKKLFEEITQEKTQESIMASYNELLSQIRTINGFFDISEKDIFLKFEKELIDSGKIPTFVKKALKNIIKSKNDYAKGILNVTETNKVLKEVRNVLTEIKEYKGRNIVTDFNRKKLLFSYGEDSFAEIIKYDNEMYLIDNGQNKAYKIEKETSREVDLSKLSFADNSKYSSFVFDEELIKNIKKTLNIDELFI